MWHYSFTFGGRCHLSGTEWNGYHRPLSHRDRGANLSRERAQSFEHTGSTKRGTAGFAGDGQGGPSSHLEEIDVEPFTGLALLQGCLQHFAKEEIEARSIQPSVRTPGFYHNCHPAALGLGS